MSIFAVADTHLSLFPGADKPMDVFGARWVDHDIRLKKSWEETVSEEDTVVIVGDISWGMRLEEARHDLDFIDALPGRKVLLKGNHDLWWSGINRLNQLYDDMRFLQNDSVVCEGICICGSRGWLTPDSDDFKESDERIYRREILRLEMSLKEAEAKMKADPSIEGMIGFLHYPPVTDIRLGSGFHDLFKAFGVKKVYYGHLHGQEAFRTALQGEYDGIDYRLVSLDNLNCRLEKVF